VLNYLTTLLDKEQSMAVATRGHQRNVSAMRVNPNVPARGGGSNFCHGHG
jgi:hypothetical protein